MQGFLGKNTTRSAVQVWRFFIKNPQGSALRTMMAIRNLLSQKAYFEELEISKSRQSLKFDVINPLICR